MNWERFGFTYTKTAKVKSELPRANAVPNNLVEVEMEFDSRALDQNEQEPRDEKSEAKESVSSFKRKKYERYSKFNPKWRSKQQVPEIVNLRSVGLDGKVKTPIKDYLVLTKKKGSFSENSKNVYDLIGCAACQMDVLRNAYKAKERSLGCKGIAARDMMLKRSEES